MLKSYFFVCLNMMTKHSLQKKWNRFIKLTEFVFQETVGMERTNKFELRDEETHAGVVLFGIFS